MVKFPFKFAFFQNKFVETKTAKISIMTNALQYGTAVFGGIRGYYNKRKGAIFLFRIEDHYKRLLNSLKILGVSLNYSLEKLKEITIELVKRNKPKTDIYLRPFAYAGSLQLSPNLARDKIFDFFIYMIPLAEYLSVDKGLRVMVSSWLRIPDTAIPARGKIAGAYINSALAKKEATDRGFDEAIFLTQDGHVCEGSGENLFIVRDNTLITPPASEEILEGITRNTVINLAKDLNLKVVERKIDKSELYLAEEAFFTGTAVQIAWIKEIDGRIIGNGKKGEIAKKLQELFFEIVRGNNKKYSPRWCTKVKI